MKLTNHNKNNSYTIPKESTIARGTITMTLAEYKDACSYLNRTYKRAYELCDTYMRDSLSLFSFFTGDTTYPKEKIVCFGVCATEHIATHYQLKNYKHDINYGIEVIK